MRKNIFELACMDINTLAGSGFTNLEDRLSERQNVIAKEILKEIRARIGFLLDVGLSYLTLGPYSQNPYRAARRSA
jgi:excinuclease ABC subunit A